MSEQEYPSVHKDCLPKVVSRPEATATPVHKNQAKKQSIPIHLKYGQTLLAKGGVEARGDTCAQKSSKTAKHTNASKVWTDRPCLPEVASRPEATPVHKNQAKQQSIPMHLKYGQTDLACRRLRRGQRRHLCTKIKQNSKAYRRIWSVEGPCLPKQVSRQNTTPMHKIKQTDKAPDASAVWTDLICRSLCRGRR